MMRSALTIYRICRRHPAARLVVLLLLLLLLVVVVASAQSAEPARVEVSPPAAEAVWVGQQLPVPVELLVIGQFSGTPQYELPQVAGAILLPPSGRPLLGTRRIDGETYTSQLLEFTLYAQRGGAIEVPAFTLRFGSKLRYDQPLLEHQIPTPAFRFQAKAPPGAAADDTVISTSDLKASETWKPQPGPAQVGDAFTRTITLRAAKVPGMLLPALAAAPVDGLAVYPQPPEIRDHSERGEATGERIERASYVCQRPGKFEIPEQLLRWWNPENSSWQEKRFPAVSLEVTANPALAETPNAAAGTVAGTAEADYWLPRLLLAIVVLLTLAYLWPHLLAYLQRRQQARAASEPAQFARLIKTCHGTDPALAYRELTGWLGRFGYTTSDLSRAGGQPLAGELIRLQQALLDIARQNWDGRRLAEALRRLRRSCLLALHSTPRYSELPPLNPGLSSTSPKPDP